MLAVSLSAPVKSADSAQSRDLQRKLAAEPRKNDLRLDEYIQGMMHKNQIVGLSMAIVRDGAIVKAKGYGLANIETSTPATPKTVYKIGSISKQFIAAGIMLLVAEGKVTLND